MLMDNKALPGFTAEWGLCVAIEYGDDLWLWDAGASDIFLKNAEQLGVDVMAAKGIAISHGHWDHTGGLPRLQEAGFSGPIFMHPVGLSKKYRFKSDDVPKDIGVPDPLPTISEVYGSREIAPGMTMVADIPRQPGNYEAVDGFYSEPDKVIPDRLPDDAYLVIRDGERVHVLLGCCHSGLRNSLDHLKKNQGISQFDTLIGGLHLYAAEEGAMKEAADVIHEFGVKQVFTGHCTGDKGLAYLRQHLQCEVQETLAGMVIEL